MADALTPWSQRVRLADVHGPVRSTLDADAGERASVAESLDLAAVERLQADVTVTPWMDGLQIDAEWSASITQVCSVSLDPFDSELSGAFQVRAVPPGSPTLPEIEPEVEIDLSTPDPPDLLDDGAVDVAALVAEHLGLELSLWPRKPGVEFEPLVETAHESPFAVLAGLPTHKR